jgi:two-component system response regulator AtoC
MHESATFPAAIAAATAVDAPGRLEFPPAVRPAAPPLMEAIGPRRHLVARSPALQAIAARARRLAEFDVPVLLLGESGCGKEVVARLIHEASPRRAHRFLKINCAALPEELLESELFGYEAGAFTGATRSKPGKFEMCQKGTLFLDEVGELPLPLQAKLLHVLQDHRFMRLGGTQEVLADVRVLAATNVDLPQAMAERQFREDLFFRLNVFALQIPPLRQRPEDIPALIEHFLQQFAAEMNCTARAMPADMLEQCLRHRWTGNVRELENFIRRFLVFGEQAWFDEAMAPAATPSAPVALPKAERNSAEGLKDLVHRVASDLERSTIARALEESRWNRTLAARALNISYRALLNKVRLYNLYPSLPKTRPAE